MKNIHIEKGDNMKKMQTKRLSLLLCLCLLISLFTFPQAAFATETDIAQLDAPAEDGAGTADPTESGL